jgi:hypothetical protein
MPKQTELMGLEGGAVSPPPKAGGFTAPPV